MARSQRSKVLTLTGIEAIDRRLMELGSKSVRRIVRSAVGGAQTLAVRIIRQEIDGDSTLSPELRSAMKRSLGTRFKRKRSGDPGYEAKFGFSVGKRRPAKRSGRNSKSGVGIGKTNAHWFAMGTRTRTVKTGRFAGKRVGKINAVLVMKRAGRRLGRALFTRMLQISREKLKQEVMILRRK